MSAAGETHEFKEGRCWSCLRGDLCHFAGPTDVEWCHGVRSAHSTLQPAAKPECRTCRTKASGLPTPGYAHDEGCTAAKPGACVKGLVDQDQYGCVIHRWPDWPCGAAKPEGEQIAEAVKWARKIQSVKHEERQDAEWTKFCSCEVDYGYGRRGDSWPCVDDIRSRALLALTTENEGLRRDLQPLFELAADLVDGMDHDDEECPCDDTCECANIARVNNVFRAARAALALSASRKGGDR